MLTNIDYKYLFKGAALTSSDVLKAENNVWCEYSFCTNINIFEQRGILRLQGKTPLALYIFIVHLMCLNFSELIIFCLFSALWCERSTVMAKIAKGMYFQVLSLSELQEQNKNKNNNV